jgi:hypothetical protein
MKAAVLDPLIKLNAMPGFEYMFEDVLTDTNDDWAYNDMHPFSTGCTSAARCTRLPLQKHVFIFFVKFLYNSTHAFIPLISDFFIKLFVFTIRICHDGVHHFFLFFFDIFLRPLIFFHRMASQIFSIILDALHTSSYLNIAGGILVSYGKASRASHAQEAIILGEVMQDDFHSMVKFTIASFGVYMIGKIGYEYGSDRYQQYLKNKDKSI